MSRDRRGARRFCAWAVVSLLCAVYLLLVSRTALHPDLIHQMALMREAAKLGRIPTEELFSYTAKAVPAIQHEWGAGWIGRRAYELGGDQGILLLHWLLAFLLAAGVAAMLRNERVRAPVLWAAVALCAYMATYTMVPVTAQTYSVLLTLALLWFLRLDARGGRWWIAAWLPLYIAWVNLHGGVSVAFAVLVGYVAERIWKRQPWLHIPAVLAAMAALIAVNPYGTQFYRFLVHALTVQRPIITEWSPRWMIDVDPFRAVMFWATLGVFVYTAQKRGWRRMDGALIVLGLALGSMRVMKLLPFYALAWLVYVPSQLGRTWLGRQVSVAVMEQPRTAGWACLALIPFTIWAAARNEPWRLSLSNFPVDAVEYLREQHFKGNLMTLYSEAPYVTWKLWPAVKVASDSRYETAYEMRWVERVFEMYRVRPAETWRGVVNAYPTDAILVGAGEPLAAVLAKQDEWPCVYRDQKWFIYANPAKLHVFRRRNAENLERPFELRPEIGREPQQERAFLGVFLGKNRIVVIERVERLGQLEGVFRDVAGLAGRKRAFERFARLRRVQHELPEVLGLELTLESFSRERRSKVGNFEAALDEFAEDVARAHRGILHVRAGLALEAQRFLQIESNHRVARKLQQEIAKRADGDGRSRGETLAFGLVRVA